MRSPHRIACAAALLTVAAAAASTLSSMSSGKVAATFSGTLLREGISAHRFTLPHDASVAVALTALGPASGQAVGFGLGTPTVAGSCALVETLPAAHVTAELGGMLRRGTYCVAIYDPGDVVVPLTYTVTVRAVVD